MNHGIRAPPGPGHGGAPVREAAGPSLGVGDAGVEALSILLAQQRSPPMRIPVPLGPGAQWGRWEKVPQLPLEDTGDPPAPLLGTWEAE